MSLFLGPIHYWLYNKIQIQQGIVEQIVEAGKGISPQLAEKLDEQFDVSESRPLEDVIDGGNIHGWLQYRVSQTESKLAAAVTELIGKQPEMLKEIEDIFAENGRKAAEGIDSSSAAAVYKALSDSLLDGMPCDHANAIMEEDADQVIWKRNTCVHKSYWEAEGGDISIYYLLRESFIKGFLSGTPFVFEKIDETVSAIKRGDLL